MTIRKRALDHEHKRFKTFARNIVRAHKQEILGRVYTCNAELDDVVHPGQVTLSVRKKMPKG